MELKSKIINKVSKCSRDRKLDQFYNVLKPVSHDRVLDVGITNSMYHKFENYFLTQYPHKEMITGLGVGDLSNAQKLFSQSKIISYDWLPDRKFPFDDKQFNVLHSNAVIEHVGDYEDQKAFLKEMVRVSSKGMATTPNKYFPIETHYKLPLIHWNDKLFNDYREKHPRSDNLVLLSKNDLVNMCEELEIPNYKIVGNKFLGVDMTLSLFWANNKSDLHF